MMKRNLRWHKETTLPQQLNQAHSHKLSKLLTTQTAWDHRTSQLSLAQGACSRYIFKVEGVGLFI